MPPVPVRAPGHVPPLASRQGADLAIGVVVHPHPLQRLVDGRHVRRTGATEPADQAAATHQDYLLRRDGERPIDRLALGYIGDSGSLVIERTPLERDLALHLGRQPQDGLQQGALAGAIRPNDRCHRAARQRDARILTAYPSPYPALTPVSLRAGSSMAAS